MSDRSHRRFNPLRGEWVLVSPERLSRPWSGDEAPPGTGALQDYDPGCYLCPGNARAGGAVNPRYSSTFVFANDFPALTDAVSPEGNAAQAPGSSGDRAADLFRERPVSGAARVICFSPDHGTTLARLPESGIAAVVDCWAQQVGELGARFPWVQVFENKGEIMGCSNPHPHGQVWAMSELPTEAVREDRCQATYSREHGSNLLLDYAREEIRRGTRVVETDEAWVALVPYWATWPFETLLVPLAPVDHLDALDAAQRLSLARILARLLTRYDNLFACSFPYSMGWHGRPFGATTATHWQLHAHFYPPLLRSAAIRKFMVGFEMLAEPQRDLTPESAAERLRALDATRVPGR